MMRGIGPEASRTATSSPWTSNHSGPTVLSRPFNGRSWVHAKRCCGRRRSPTTCTGATASGRSWFKRCTTREPKRSQHATALNSDRACDHLGAAAWRGAAGRQAAPDRRPLLHLVSGARRRRLSPGFAGTGLRRGSHARIRVEQATTVELVVNVTTARALDIALAPSVLLRAEQVVK